MTQPLRSALLARPILHAVVALPGDQIADYAETPPLASVGTSVLTKLRYHDAIHARTSSATASGSRPSVHRRFA